MKIVKPIGIKIVTMLAMSFIFVGCFESNGEVRIHSSHSGATIYVDDEKRGLTTNGESKIIVSSGDHKIKIYKEHDKWSYLESKENVYLEKDSSVELYIKLEKRLTQAGIERKKEKRLYHNAKTMNEFNNYLKKCKYCEYKKDANSQIDKLFFREAVNLKTINALNRYLKECITCDKYRIKEANRLIDKLLYYEAVNLKTIKALNRYLKECTICDESRVGSVKELIPLANNFETRYIDNKNGVLTDKKTKLMWMRHSIDQHKWKNKENKKQLDKLSGRENRTFPWKNAINAINIFNKYEKFAGYDDWRLPTFNELKSLVYCKDSASPETFCENKRKKAADYYNTIAFPKMKGSYYWTLMQGNDIKSIMLKRGWNHRGENVVNGTLRGRIPRYNRILLVRESGEHKTKFKKARSTAIEKVTDRALSQNSIVQKQEKSDPKPVSGKDSINSNSNFSPEQKDHQQARSHISSSNQLTDAERQELEELRAEKAKVARKKGVNSEPVSQSQTSNSRSFQNTRADTRTDGSETYYARISQRDHYGKNGQKLKGVGIILQQDRANYHKYHKRDREDTGDNRFDTRGNRNKIKRMLARGSTSQKTLDAIRYGTPLVKVKIYPEYIDVTLESGGGQTQQRQQKKNSAQPRQNKSKKSKCNTDGSIRGISSRGDGFVAVRKGPGTKHRMVGKIYRNGTRVKICDRKGKWKGIIYGDCIAGSSRSQSGSCKGGWVYEKYIRTK